MTPAVDSVLATRDAFGPLALSQVGVFVFLLLCAVVGFVIYAGLVKIFARKSALVASAAQTTTAKRPYPSASPRRRKPGLR